MYACICLCVYVCLFVCMNHSHLNLRTEGRRSRVGELRSSSGASIPSETMMHFPPCFRFPSLFKKKFLDFHPPKFLMTFFLVIDHKFRITPLFSLFQYISPP